MNDDNLNDLKQFIAATVSQQTSSLREDVAQDIAKIIKEELRKLEAKMDEGFAGVSDAIEAITQTIEPKIDDHEVRITKLESQAA